MNKIEKLHENAFRDCKSETYFPEYVEYFSEGMAASKSAEITEQIAVEFGNWIAQVGAYPCITTSNKGLYVLDARDPKNYTSEELFQEFLKTKQ